MTESYFRMVPTICHRAIARGDTYTSEEELRMKRKNLRKTGALLLALSMVGSGMCYVPAQVQAEETSTEGNVIDGYDVSKEYTVSQDGVTYHAYLSQDRSQSWIYKADVTKNCKQVKFPSSVDGTPVTRIGHSYSLNKGDEFNCNVFGGWVEYAHGVDGYKDTFKNIEKVVIPSKVTQLEDTTFAGLRNLKKVILSDAVTVIPGEAFYGCKSLSSITLPKSLTTIEHTAFADCNALKKVTLSSECRTMKVKNGCLLSKNGRTLWWVAPGLKKVTVPDTVRVIKEYAAANKVVTKVILGKKVSDIRMFAFQSRKLKDIQIKKGNKTIAKKGQCIYNKKNGTLLVGIAKNKKLKICSKVKKLDEKVLSLAGIRYLVRLDIPSSVKALNGRWTENIEVSSSGKIFFHGAEPPRVMGAVDESICYVPIFLKVYVPKKSLKKYKRWYKAQDALSYVTLKTIS